MSQTSPETETVDVEALARRVETTPVDGKFGTRLFAMSDAERDLVVRLLRSHWDHTAEYVGFGHAQCQQVPEGATHMRRPEYLTAWLFDGSVMPIWLIRQFKSTPLPESRRGHYATAVDGEFWRWFDPAKFNELFVAVADTSTDRQ